MLFDLSMKNCKRKSDFTKLKDTSKSKTLFAKLFFTITDVVRHSTFFQAPTPSRFKPQLLFSFSEEAFPSKL